MKLVSKSILFILVCFILSTRSSIAQRAEFKGVVEVQAVIAKNIEVITIQGMKIPRLQPGQKQAYLNPINNANSGHMIAYGNEDSDIRINYVRSKVVNQTNGPGVIRINYEVSGNTKDNQQASELLGNDNRNLRFNSEGIYYIWVGGTINVENAAPGNYTGNFTLEIEYI